MGLIHWIEDESELLPDLASELEVRGHTIRRYSNVQQVLDPNNGLKVSSAPILLDLFLPAADFDCGRVRGHSVGLELVAVLLEKAQLEDPPVTLNVFIVSGNVDLSVSEKLRTLQIDESRIFEKPLNDRFDSLIADVDQVARNLDKPVLDQ